MRVTLLLLLTGLLRVMGLLIIFQKNQLLQKQSTRALALRKYQPCPSHHMIWTESQSDVFQPLRILGSVRAQIILYFTSLVIQKRFLFWVLIQLFLTQSTALSVLNMKMTQTPWYLSMLPACMETEW